MDIDEVTDILRNNINKQMTSILSTEASESEQLVDTLISIMFKGKHPENWRAAWVLDHTSLINIKIIEPHLPFFLKQLPTIQFNGIKRHIIRMLVNSRRKDLIDGNLINLCFEWLQASHTPIAVRAFSMDIIDMITNDYPDLIQEFVLVLEEIAINGSKGEKNKATKLIKKYSKISPNQNQI